MASRTLAAFREGALIDHRSPFVMVGTRSHRRPERGVNGMHRADRLLARGKRQHGRFAMSETRKQRMESDFNPGYLPESMPGLDTRMVNAAEYSAYQLGQINRSLSRLVQ